MGSKIGASGRASYLLCWRNADLEMNPPFSATGMLAPATDLSSSVPAEWLTLQNQGKNLVDSSGDESPQYATDWLRLFAAAADQFDTAQGLGYSGAMPVEQRDGDATTYQPGNPQQELFDWMQSSGYNYGINPTFNGGQINTWLDPQGQEVAGTRREFAAPDDSALWNMALGMGGIIAGPLLASSLGSAGAGAVLGGGSQFLSGADAAGVLRGALGGGLGGYLAGGAGNLAAEVAAPYGAAAESVARGGAGGFTRGALNGVLRGDFDFNDALVAGLSGGANAGVSDFVGGGDVGRFAGNFAGSTIAGLGRGNDLGSAIGSAAIGALRSPGSLGALRSLLPGSGEPPDSNVVGWPAQNPEPVNSFAEVPTWAQGVYGSPNEFEQLPRELQQSFAPGANTWQTPGSSGDFGANFGGGDAQRGDTMFDFQDTPGGDIYGLGDFSQNPPDSFGWGEIGRDTNTGAPSWTQPEDATPTPSFNGDAPWWSSGALGSEFGQPPSGLDYGNEGRNYPTPEATQGSGGSPTNSSTYRSPLEQVARFLRGGGGGGSTAPSAGGAQGGDGSYMNLIGMIGLISALQQSRRGGSGHSPSALRAMLPQNSPMSAAQSSANAQLMTAPLTKYQAPNTADSLRRYGVDVNAPGYAEGGGVSPLGRISQDLEAYMHEGPGHVADGDGGGQDDLVDARLSPGEYVFDADAVSALGDGNNDEGARRLDAMRVALREHKRGAASDRIPPKAKSPLEYLAAATKE